MVIWRFVSGEGEGRILYLRVSKIEHELTQVACSSGEKRNMDIAKER